MTLRLRNTVSAITVLTVSMCLTINAAANPLCATPVQRQWVQAALSDLPKSSFAQIAKSTGLTEAAVVNGFPEDVRTPVSIAEFNDVWNSLTDWEDAVLIAPSSESVFEMSGPLPAGNMARGYFNFDAPDSPYGGHLKMDRLAAIYLLSTDDRDGETHQVAVFDDTGRRVFSVYVPREEGGALKTQPHSRFLRMKLRYREHADQSFLTDAGCLWTGVEWDPPIETERD